MNFEFILFLFDRFSSDRTPTKEQVENAYKDYIKKQPVIDVADLDRGY